MMRPAGLSYYVCQGKPELLRAEIAFRSCVPDTSRAVVIEGDPTDGGFS